MLPRRKSGNSSGDTSMADVRKGLTVADPAKKHPRQAMVKRKTAPQKLGKSPKEREKNQEDDCWLYESFPQYCMACEKQFVSQDERALYCSEACRAHDQHGYGLPTTTSSQSCHHPAAYSPHPASAEPRDIIPRASPSRPIPTYFSPPSTPVTSHSSAIASLRSLTMAPPSPPSPSDGYHPSIWSFSRSAVNSHKTGSLAGPSWSGHESTCCGASPGSHGHLFDRPLSSRKPPYARPKSVELVTPILSRS